MSKDYIRLLNAEDATVDKKLVRVTVANDETRHNQATNDRTKPVITRLPFADSTMALSERGATYWGIAQINQNGKREQQAEGDTDPRQKQNISNTATGEAYGGQRRPATTSSSTQTQQKNTNNVVTQTGESLPTMSM